MRALAVLLLLLAVLGGCSQEMPPFPAGPDAAAGGDGAGAGPDAPGAQQDGAPIVPDAFVDASDGGAVDAIGDGGSDAIGDGGEDAPPADAPVDVL